MTVHDALLELLRVVGQLDADLARLRLRVEDLERERQRIVDAVSRVKL